MEFPIRINKYIAERGLASRREADALIESGQIRINGTPATLGQQVAEGDVVELIGSRSKKRYYRFYKPRGIITHSPAEHEVDIETFLQEKHNLTGVYPIGRLDKDSEGLIILTDDGRITGPLLDPDNGYEKEYLVALDKPLAERHRRQLESGVNIEGYTTKPARAAIDPKDATKLTLTITEGKKHQIRRMCAALGYQVKKLKRTRILHLTLAHLTPGKVKRLERPEITELLAALKVTR